MKRSTAYTFLRQGKVRDVYADDDRHLLIVASDRIFDKQYVRDYLERIHWDKQLPAPRLPDEVVGKTAEKYEEALMRLTVDKK